MAFGEKEARPTVPGALSPLSPYALKFSFILKTSW